MYIFVASCKKSGRRRRRSIWCWAILGLKYKQASTDSQPIFHIWPSLTFSIILDWPWPIALVKGAEESSSIIIHLLDPFDPSFNEVDVLVNYCTMCVYERASRACLTQKRGWCEASNASCLYFKSNLAQRQVDPPFSPPTLFTRNDKNIQNMVL